MADDLDRRLRQALHQTSTAWQPSDVSTDDIVGGVRRERARRRRRTTTIGCVAVVAIALGAGAYGYASGPHGTSASASRAPSAAVAGPADGSPASPSAASAGSGATGLHKAGQRAACPASVQVGAGSPHCAGELSSPNAAQSAVAGNAAGTPEAAAVTVSVGQRITVTLAPAPVGGWGAPRTSTLSEPDRRAFGIASTVTAGRVHTLRTTREVGTQPASAVYRAVSPGVIVLTAPLTGPCSAASSAPATTVAPSCTDLPTRWTFVLLVRAR